MGRRRGNKKKQSASPGNSTTKNVAGGAGENVKHGTNMSAAAAAVNPGWNSDRDRKDLLTYLDDYRDRVKALLVQQQQQQQQQQRYSPPASASRKRQRDPGSSTLNDDTSTSATTTTNSTIGGIDLPDFLTTRDDVLTQPFLALPSSLTSKQRRVVHECCNHVNLFHYTATTTTTSTNNASTNSHRYIAISLYADGFQTLLEKNDDNRIDGASFVLEEGHDNKKSNTAIVSVYKYQSWYARHKTKQPVVVQEDDLTPLKSNVAESAARLQKLNNSWGKTACSDAAAVATEEECAARRLIDQLIRHPGDCLREMIDDLDGEAMLLSTDLSNMDPPQRITQNHPTTPASPSASSAVCWMLVDSAEKMKTCIDQLERSQPTELAFDLECYNRSKYAQLTCLIQITSNNASATAGNTMEYVIDTLAPGVWDEVHGLARLFANPAIVKVGHSIGGLDVRSLHRDFGIIVVNAFDTYEASLQLQLDRHSLSAVCRHYGMPDCDSHVYQQLKDTYQRCDWRVRPLTTEMILYGRHDVHYLLKLRRLMMRDLIITNTTPQQHLQQQQQVMVDDKARLDAASLAATLQQIEHAEQDVKEQPQQDDDDDDGDDDTFRTSVQQVAATTARSENGDNDTASQYEKFYTPSESFEDDYQDDIAMIATNNDDTDQPQEPTQNTTATHAVSVATLRLNPRLMAVIRKSQHHCKKLWSGATEAPLKNSFFATLLARAKRGEFKNDCTWEGVPQMTQLYLDLVKWRDSVAAHEDMQCLPAFVAPLDFLARVAWKRPRSVTTLRRIAADLPEALRDEPALVEQLLEIVRKNIKKNTNENDNNGSSKEEEEEIYWYYRERNAKERKGSNGRMLLKVALTISVIAGLTYIVLTTTARKRARR